MADSCRRRLPPPAAGGRAMNPMTCPECTWCGGPRSAIRCGCFAGVMARAYHDWWEGIGWKKRRVEVREEDIGKIWPLHIALLYPKPGRPPISGP